MRAHPRGCASTRLASLFFPEPRNVLCHRRRAVSPRPTPCLVTISAPMWLDVKNCLIASFCLPASLACSPSTSQGTGAAPIAAPAEEAPSQTGVTTPTAAPAPGAEPVGQPSAESVMPDTPPDPARSLPEVTVRNVGLHIGGGSNDAASKEPFQRAIAARFEAFLDRKCVAEGGVVVITRAH